jgi:queuine tRNA-ribosyltransferase
MGGAQPDEIVGYVQRGVDMFDCVLPTRNARHGSLYRWKHDDLMVDDFYEVAHITNEKWKFSQEALSANSQLDELRDFSMGYLRHLFTVNELLAFRLATLVNIEFYLELMKRIREKG